MCKKLLKSDYFTHTILIGLSFLIGIYVFKDFFGFSLWGDDWMLMFYTLEHKIAGVPMKIFFSEYGGQAILMEIVRSLYGFDARYYFYVSYFLRFIAALSLYLLLFNLNKNKILAFLTSVLFLVSFAGIESTNWVHNSINYLALALTAFGFIFSFEHLKTKKLFSWKIVTAYTLFTIAFILATVRMHGLIFLYPLTELIFVVAKKSKTRYAIIRSVVLIGLFYILMKSGLFGNAGSETIGRFNNSFIYFINQSNENLYKALIFPFGSFFNSLFPLYVFEYVPFLNDLLFGLRFQLADVFVWFVPIFVIFFVTYIKIRRGLFLFVATLIFWLTFLFFVSKAFYLGLGLKGSESLLGGMTFTMLIYLLIVVFLTLKNTIWANLFFLISWPFCFLIIPHALNTTHTTIESYSRYLTLPAGGSQLIITYGIYAFLNLLKHKFSRKIASSLAILLILFIAFTNLKGANYFFRMFNYRYSKHVEPTWESLNKASSDILYNGRIRVFVFNYDRLDAYQTMIGFGGWYRYAFENNITDRQKLVVFLGVNEVDQIIQSFKDPRKGVENTWGVRIKDQLKLEDIYGFELKGDRVVRNDYFIREDLKKYAI